MFFLDWI